MLSAASRAGKTNHSAVRAIRSPGTCRVVRRIPIAREQKRLAHASATPDRTKSSSKSITKSKKGFSRQHQRRREVLEEDMSLQRHPAQAEVGHRLGPPHRDEQEPAEGQRHVHVPQQRVDPEDAAVEQRIRSTTSHDALRASARVGMPNRTRFLSARGSSAEPHAPLPRHDGGTSPRAPTINGRQKGA